MRTRYNFGTWHCDHHYPSEVKTVQDGESARCLRCSTSGPVRASEEGALQALRDKANH